MEWVWSWMAEIGVPAAIRPMTGTWLTEARPVSPAGASALRPSEPSITAGLEGAALRGGRRAFRQFQYFQSTGAVRQAADEATLLQRCDETMDAGLRLQVQGVLHLVERGRDAGLRQNAR